MSVVYAISGNCGVRSRTDAGASELQRASSTFHSSGPSRPARCGPAPIRVSQRVIRVEYYTSVRLLCAVLSAAALLAQAPPPSPDDAKKIATGRKIYAGEKCAECHQIAGHGNSRFPLDGVGARLSAADLRRWFTHTEEMERAQPKRPAIRMSSRKYRFNDE